MIPSVNVTTPDGGLGITSTGSSACALIGVSSTGTPNLPTACTKVETLVSTFGVGPGVEAAALIISTGTPCLFIKADTATEGSVGTVTFTGTGTAVPTTDITETTPLDKYEVLVEVTAGGTVGTAGVKYRYSYDGGRTRSPVQSLGTSTSFEIPNVCEVALAAGTLDVGDTIEFRTVEPTLDATTLLAALNAYKASAVNTQLLHVVGALTGALGGVIDTTLGEMAALNKPSCWIGNTRIPNVGESDAAYQTVMQTISDAYATVHGSLWAGSANIVSAVSGRQYMRPISFRVAADQARQIALGNEHVDLADINLGSLVGTSLVDINGNPTQHHDEFVMPGLDDMRFGTLRTWPTFAGAYVTLPRIFSQQGSDFQIIPHRLILNIAHRVAYQNLALRLNRPILIDKTTGYIHESDAVEIELGCESALSSALLARPKASAVDVIVSRVDNILATNTLTVTIRVVPLGYLFHIDCNLSFLNPATIAA